VETGNVWADTGTPDPAAVMRRLAWRFGEEPDLGRRRNRPRGYRVAMADDARRAARSVGGLIVLSGWYVALVPVLGHVIPPLRTASAEDRDIAWRTCRVTKSVQCGLAQMDLQLTGVAVLVLAVAAALLLVLSAAISLLAFVLLFRAGVRSPVVVGTGSAFAGWLATAALGGLAVLAVWH
jgi:hypothetical protein